LFCRRLAIKLSPLIVPQLCPAAMNNEESCQILACRLKSKNSGGLLTLPSLSLLIVLHVFCHSTSVTR
jgi:hypothetical protein